MSHKVVALLDTMWGTEGRRAPRWFHINPQNASGRRLYKLVGEFSNSLVVTNCCPIMQTSASKHGVPDAAYVADNLRQLQPDLLLVCGAVAVKTYAASGYTGAVLQLKHPAARNWTRAEIAQTAKKIKAALGKAQTSALNSVPGTSLRLDAA